MNGDATVASSADRTIVRPFVAPTLPCTPDESRIKALIDVAGAAFLLLFLAPLFVVVAIAIKVDSAGPVFFRQTRAGARGKPFRIYKFRTMHTCDDGHRIVQARRRDARVTAVGRFLRKSSIDELPQILNVLEGDMSLTGPRPHARAHDDYYSLALPNYRLRQYAKPGISGLAQVRGHRGETPTLRSMGRRIASDAEYVGNWSLVLDFKILVRSFLVFFKSGQSY